MGPFHAEPFAHADTEITDGPNRPMDQGIGILGRPIGIQLFHHFTPRFLRRRMAVIQQTFGCFTDFRHGGEKFAGHDQFQHGPFHHRQRQIGQ